MADQLWFTTARLTIHLSKTQNADGITLIEHHMAAGFAVPLHAHHGEDESFYFVDGEVRMQIRDEIHTMRPGQALTIPKGVPHSFRVVSDEARFLSFTTGRFEDMVRSLARPAEREGLPPQTAPTEEQIAELIAACRAHDIEFLGPAVK
ncbi:cupin domain-containing protein [Aureimonas phyllosphaerae]|uniref:Mannose-6-phosphate isomerase-like protein (Cupin superfamily) n=1 Tax=Aureimonas phyllosphaerae TaxID=1166078 RepID=A0A7W6BWS6_9HYPH|nr:cupin domain-containing protein [Aureimonas phyllosphaerae]MBB3938332.1 mannose-6-phosphate isomerase-like protein (cupin superfamily) [Aureimonas phyllosphaerae]MBB3962336.1 mannose-6-phosphate isomerase-like protein (cupin superfamily) [Aureimonas phyllosphaerae]SFF60136.1 Cupin domain protein [Aureimonas phyllosphaerae]